MTDANRPPAERAGSPAEVFAAFLKLGLTSFGGPIAHLGYFRDELVVRRKWIDEAGYADLIALCQFLPGPASSQVGFSLGVLRGGGLLGGLAAWTAFTLPSAIIMVAFALGAASIGGPVADGVIAGLKLMAVAVIAQAIWGMTRTLTPDATRAGIALFGVGAVIILPGAIGQIGAILLGAVAGYVLCTHSAGDATAKLAFPVARVQGAAALILFVMVFLVAPLAAVLTGAQAIQLFDAFYRAGALVFGGGHVVLPLLQSEVVPPGWMSNETFLAGYGLAQAIPGPLFTFAAYLGAAVEPAPNGLAGAAIGLLAIFLPGILLVYGMLPFWDRLRAQPAAQAAMKGTNAAVVGILGAALYDPVFVSAVETPPEFLLALAGFLALTIWKAPPWLVVAALALAGGARALI